MVLFRSTGNATLDELAVRSGAATPELVVEWATLLSLVLVASVLRTYARMSVSGFRGLGWDDLLGWVAAILYAALSVNVYIIGVMTEGLASDGLSDEQRLVLSQNPEGLEYKLRRSGAMAQVIKLLVYALVLWTLKASLLYYFAVRLTGGIPGAKARTWASVGLLVVTFLGCLAALFTSCRPLQNMWQIYPNPGTMCEASISPLIIFVFLGCNILSDIYLVSLPIPVLIRAPLKSTQKLSLICLFSCNILITGMAIVRAVYIIRDPWANGDGMWEIRETFVAVITTSLPPIAPLIRKWRCFGRKEKLSTAERVEAAKKRASRASQAPSRSASKASLKAAAEAMEDKVMVERYLSGFNGQERPPTSSSGSDHSRSNSMVSFARMDEAGAKQTTVAMSRGPRAIATPEPHAMSARGYGRDEHAAPQAAREIV